MTSSRMIPLLFINLGGEMLYIIDQRLRAQNIEKDKAIKVVDDIVSIMLSEKFLAELFKPQVVYNKQALRKLFEDLAHGSIMRLNSSSMDKLYELMMMAFKYQLFAANLPSDILLITSNHLDAIRSFVTTSAIQKQVDVARGMFTKIYGKLSEGELQTIRYSLLNFFQDLKVKVSLFLRQELQTQDSTFVIVTNGTVPPGIEVPGFIRIFNSNGDIIEVRHFPSGGDYHASSQSSGSVDIVGNRQIKLGCNMYRQSSSEDGGGLMQFPEQFLHTEVTTQGHPQKNEDNSAASISTGSVAQLELNLLLTQLMRDRVEQHSSADVIALNLFGTLEEEQEFTAQRHQPAAEHFVNIDVRIQNRSAELEKIYSEMSVISSVSVAGQEEAENDLLDLLDTCS